jgi:hypothetical protein
LKGRACTNIKREVQLDLGVLTGVIMDGLNTVFRHSTNRTRTIDPCKEYRTMVAYMLREEKCGRFYKEPNDAKDCKKVIHQLEEYFSS